MWIHPQTKALFLSQKTLRKITAALACLILLWTIPVPSLAEDLGTSAKWNGASLSDGLLFYAPFDGSSDALVSQGDRRASNPGLHFVYRKGIAGEGLLVSELVKSTPPEYYSEGNISSEQGTIAFWFQPEWNASDPIQGRWPNRWFFSSRGGDGRFYFFCLRKVIAFDYFVKTDTSDWKSGDWHHVALTWNRFSSFLYVDGRLAAKTSPKNDSLKNISFGPTFQVGAYQNRFPAGGTIDEFGIWSRPLLQEEVARLHSRGLRGVGFFGRGKTATIIKSHRHAQDHHDVPNAINNGSFEAGASNWLQIEIPSISSPSYPSFVSLNQNPSTVSIVNDTAFHGRRSLRLRIDGRGDQWPKQGTGSVSTLAFRLNPEQTYTVTARVKTNKKGALGVTLHLTGVRQTSKPPSPMRRTVNIKPGDHRWHTIQFSGRPGEAYDNLYRLQLFIGNKESRPTEVYVDGFQVTPTHLATFSSRYLYDRAITGTLSTSMLGNIFDFGAPIILNTGLANQSTDDRSTGLAIEIYDFWDNKIASKSIQKSIHGLENSTIPYRFELERTGIFRAVLVAGDSGKVIDELRFSVLPRVDKLASLGAHPTLGDYTLAIAARMGVSRIRLWDNGKPTAWPTVQPQNPNEFRWERSDYFIGNASEHGFELLGMISWPQTQWASNWVSQNRPHWLHTKWNSDNTPSPPEYLLEDPTFWEQWERYVHAVVGRYQKEIRLWELLNEPYLDHSAEWVMELYKRTVPIIRAANPRALIVGPSTHLRPEWTNRLISLGILELIDIFSYHGYGLNRAALRTIMQWSAQDGIKRPVLDTENSAHASSQLFCESCLGTIFTGAVPYKLAAARMGRSFLQAKGAGTATYFHYWMVHYDAYQQYGSLLNFDGTLRPPAVVFSIAGWMTDGLESKETLSLRESVPVYIFTDSSQSRAVATLWNDTEKSIQVFIPIDGTSVKTYDLMGNRIKLLDGTKLILTEEGYPFYFTANDPTELATAFRKAKIKFLD